MLIAIQDSQVMYILVSTIVWLSKQIKDRKDELEQEQKKLENKNTFNCNLPESKHCSEGQDRAALTHQKSPPPPYLHQSEPLLRYLGHFRPLISVSGDDASSSRTRKICLSSWPSTWPPPNQARLHILACRAWRLLWQTSTALVLAHGHHWSLFDVSKLFYKVRSS